MREHQKKKDKLIDPEERKSEEKEAATEEQEFDKKFDQVMNETEVEKGLLADNEDNFEDIEDFQDAEAGDEPGGDAQMDSQDQGANQ